MISHTDVGLLESTLSASTYPYVLGTTTYPCVLTVKNAYFATDVSGRICRWSLAYPSTWGYSRNSYMGTDVHVWQRVPVKPDVQWQSKSLRRGTHRPPWRQGPRCRGQGTPSYSVTWWCSTVLETSSSTNSPSTENCSSNNRQTQRCLYVTVTWLTSHNNHQAIIKRRHFITAGKHYVTIHFETVLFPFSYTEFNARCTAVHFLIRRFPGRRFRERDTESNCGDLVVINSICENDLRVSPPLSTGHAEQT